MPTKQNITKRYDAVSDTKADGATFTPKLLADFVADNILNNWSTNKSSINIIDPAVGDGELLISILTALHNCYGNKLSIAIHGYDTNAESLAIARQRISHKFPEYSINLIHKDFLEVVLQLPSYNKTASLFSQQSSNVLYDIVIANPPYVRTQIMGAEQAQKLANSFGLKGRVDLYHAFLIGISQILSPDGTAGIIVSNRFMTTKGGNSLRSYLRSNMNIKQIWDLGDTKLFGAAVLPAVIVTQGGRPKVKSTIPFVSIYECQDQHENTAESPIEALAYNSVVKLSDDRIFHVQHGQLDISGSNDDIWRISTKHSNKWISTVDANTWKRFGDIGKIRVGVKTTADKIFIRSDWHQMHEDERPELLQHLITHHVGSQYKPKAADNQKMILYTHESISGRKSAIDISKYPKARKYLESHRQVLESRTYVIESGRNWYEIWVPQDPSAWKSPKLVFRDITEEPTFWLDFEGSIVNGDCYWLAVDNLDVLWLAAAIANSKFIEEFYDRRFNNKLYAGRRRFITQYVEQFPLPEPSSKISTSIISLAKEIYNETDPNQRTAIKTEIDKLVLTAFGL